ncbi:hypothetical protein SPHI_25520 [Sphingomonas jeddahensis]|uniref:Uncharacterized protein n=1 Tax=Sphingomonas jeddahensis TaxID=1915074 RepID=A0A1V2ES18_9SPHN|nr:hypothetical protein SPHI_25520 [Sphingomonas jeddahensis]
MVRRPRPTGRSGGVSAFWEGGRAAPASIVIPAEGGIDTRGPSWEPRAKRLWIPAFAGITALLYKASINPKAARETIW